MDEIKDFNETKKFLEEFEGKKEVLSSVELSPFQSDIQFKEENYYELLKKIGFKKEEAMEVPRVIQKEEIHTFENLKNLTSLLVAFRFILSKILSDFFTSIVKKGSELRISLTLLPLKTVGVKKQLVLVNLPINEQIHELEQIIFGLINGEFNKEEKEIIKKEVEGLWIYIQKNKIDLTTLNEVERAEIETRNNALERARRLLMGEE
ncbi:MAG: hypothetical protein ACP5HJ_01550 [Candidatus Micrarchaeia archaeon]|jgi:hypothetical protein